jgi:hypothetical protein
MRGVAPRERAVRSGSSQIQCKLASLLDLSTLPFINAAHGQQSRSSKGTERNDPAWLSNNKRKGLHHWSPTGH